ncbi:phospholipase B [Neolentinus lepideus HHB14362 ss-1]|uniref:Lysophospholipase n=1 Tax=Neolentinus lepideus HHB14362 ss-1 TaxID=1314782 RepID=A0A165QC71_9AGAM|nr:phospholipase B [Neolentinus lepideus HHB14362 ss-1]
MLLPLPLLALTLGLVAAASNEGSVTDYAPATNVQCPDTPLVRVFTPQNQTLHPQEVAYVNARAADVLPGAWKDWIGDGTGIGYNASVMQAMEGNWSKIGIGISGGGFRAAQYGAGVLSGLDARNESAMAAGTGGLLQVASYLSGLSGGSWITGSLYLNNWPTIKDMVFGNGGNLSGWLLDLNLAAPAGVDLFNEDNQYFFGSLLWSIEAKAMKGLDTSITDPWARMISYHFLNQTTRANFFTNNTAHGAGQLWSNIPETAAWQQLQPPFPIIVSDSRPVGSNMTTALPPGPVVYEMTPLEFGSWDPNLSAMVNMTYAGTHFVNGTPPNETACVTGFDQAGFIMGSSASLFNQILDFAQNTLQGFSSQDASGLLYVLGRQLQEVSTRANDVANWPNPFQGLKSQNFEDSASDWLELIDGSSNGENVPIGQLFVRARGLDVVVAVDSSADEATNLWPNGSSIVKSASRISTLLLASHQLFPPIPMTPDDFISTGVNRRPTFFGCYPTQNPPEYPMLIYLPNSPPLNGDNPTTNTGTFQIAYTPVQTRIFIDQVHNNTIGGFLPNTTGPDPNFGKCLQCAAVDRARYKISPMPSRSDFCGTCFQQYCFDPQNPPSQSELPGRQFVFVDPDPQGVSGALTFFAAHKAALIGGFVGLFVVIALLVTFLCVTTFLICRVS